MTYSIWDCTAGDCAYFPPGFKTRWHVVNYIKKTFAPRPQSRWNCDCACCSALSQTKIGLLFFWQ